jgi:hypothetical protein
MSNAKRMLAAFVGSKAAHGKTKVGRIGRNGKADADSRIVHESLTEIKMQGHIDGDIGIGAIPINENNQCIWGALDIDDYDLDHEDLHKKITELELPLLHCRSKSGGAHLYLFVDDFIDAAILREYLLEISIAMGYSGCEIFPKQDKILSERGDVGNFINLPYQNAELTMRYCYNDNNEAMEITEFLDAIEEKRVKISDLETLKFSAKREYFKDGPPCLAHIFRNGPVNEERNKTLFQIGVYCRKKFGDDWEPEVETQNRQMFTSPLEAKEVIGIQKSLTKKDYRYTCKQEPFKSYCDPELCAMRQYGIGDMGENMPQIGGLTILLSEPRLYFMDINGTRIHLSTEQLQNQMLWQRACMEQAQIMPPTVRPQQWQRMVSNLMSNATQLEAHPELTISGQFHDLLRTFCTSRIRAMEPEELLMGKPWTENGRTMFKIAGLMEFLHNRRFTHYTPAEVQEQIKKLNDNRDCNGHHAITKEDGGRTTVRVWWVPEYEEEEMSLAPKEYKDDIPF